MSEIVADPPDPSCYLLFSGPGIEQFQLVDPDPSLSRARGRFAKGSSGDLRGRPRHKPDLLRPLCAQLLSPALPSADPAKPAGAAGSRLWRPLRAAETAPGAGCSALAVGRTARFFAIIRGTGSRNSRAFGARD
jgi:hypothetical protein